MLRKTPSKQQVLAIEKELVDTTKWELKLIGSLETVEQIDSRQNIIDYRDWLLGGENLEWQIERTLDGVLLKRR